MGCGASSITRGPQEKSHNDSGLDLEGIHRNINNSNSSDSAASSTTSITTLELRQWAAQHRLAAGQSSRSPAASEVGEGNVPIVVLNFVESSGAPTPRTTNSQRTSQLTSPVSSTSSRGHRIDSDGSSHVCSPLFLCQFDFPEAKTPSNSASSTPGGMRALRDTEETVTTLITSETDVSTIE